MHDYVIRMHTFESDPLPIFFDPKSQVGNRSVPAYKTYLGKSVFFSFFFLFFLFLPLFFPFFLLFSPFFFVDGAGWVRNGS